MFRKLDGRVKLWTTLNEPWVSTDAGYLHGVHAPGHRSPFEAPIASHRLLLAHAEAVRAYRAEGRHRIGLVVNLEPKYPASDDAADRAATARADAYMNRQYLDPVYLGRYPEELAEVFGEAWPRWAADDLGLIKEPIDFVGVNYYTRNVTLRSAGVRSVRRRPHKRATHTETGWEVWAPVDRFLTGCSALRQSAIYGPRTGRVLRSAVAPRDRVADPLRVGYIRTISTPSRRDRARR